MRRLFFTVLIALICFSTQGFAATLINENFDAYTPGNIPPSPWVVVEAAGSIRVNNSIFSSFPNSVAVTSGDASDVPNFAQPHSPIANRVVYEAYLLTNNVAAETLVMVASGNGQGNGIGPHISLGGPDNGDIPAGHLAAWDGVAWTDIMAISNDTWYHIKLDVNVLLKTYDIYVNDMATPVVTGVNFVDPGSTVLYAVAFVVYGSAFNPNPPDPGFDVAYVDNVIVLSQDSTAVPTMNQWGMIIFLALIGLGAVYYMRRQKRANS